MVSAQLFIGHSFLDHSELLMDPNKSDHKNMRVRKPKELITENYLLSTVNIINIIKLKFLKEDFDLDTNFFN